MQAQKDRTPMLLAGVLAGALFMRLALVVLLRNEQTHDLRIFASWAQLVMHYGLHHLYEHVDPIDHFPVNYPPLFSLIIAAIAALYEGTVRYAGADPVRLSMFLKLPAIAADLVLCVLAFLIVRRWAPARTALAAASIAAFAPTTWPISAVWGQVDSLCSAFMVFALALVFIRRYTLAWCALALAVLIKPLPIVVAPLIFAVQIRDQGWTVRMLLGPACAIAIAYLVSLPFAPAAAPYTVAHWLLNQYVTGQSLTHWTSVNAYNIWTLARNPMPDGGIVLGLPLHAWGWVFFAVVLTLDTWLLYRGIAARENGAVREEFMTTAWFIVLAAFFLFQTRMHERYILLALALLPLMWYAGRWERAAAATFTATFTICVVLVLGFYEHGVLEENAALTHVLSLINLAAFAAVAASYFNEARRAYELPPVSSNGEARSKNSAPIRPQS